MLTRKAIDRSAGYTARLAPRGRPHGRQRGYAHIRSKSLPPCERAEQRPTLVMLAVTMGVFIFLLLVVAGAMQPGSGPLIKSEPVSTARMP